MMVSRYAHAKQYKRMRGSVKQLNTYLGRVVRDIERQVARIREKVAIFSDLIGLSLQLLRQKNTAKTSCTVCMSRLFMLFRKAMSVSLTSMVV